MELILIATFLVGLYMAWNIGANDVANAMGTSVGSGALTFKRAVVLAAVFEFGGAVLAGGQVTSTVGKGLVSADLFAGDPTIIVYGMCSALFAAAVWLHLASYLGWPVSTTHSIVGAVCGFGLAVGGVGAVDWSMMGKIVMSWFVSPVMGAVIGFVVFSFIRQAILDKEDPGRAAVKIGPWLVFPVGLILTLSFVYKGLKNLKLDLPFAEAFLVATLVGLAMSGIAKLLLPGYVERAVAKEQSSRVGGMDIRYVVVERIFVVLQILTACMVAFAHGSNDVANAVGPIAAAYGVAKSGLAGANVGVPIWILALGGVGIVVGLATFGTRVIATVGSKITEMTPTRGFSAEFAAATTILLGSRLGLPLSTTHTLVGSVIGVGLARGIAALDTRILRGIVASWFATVPFAAMLSALVFVLLTSFRV